MGNISSMARASTALDSYVAELGNDISYDKSLSSSRFLKTILARHAYGPIVLKIFIKPDSAMSLRVIQRRLKSERDLLADLPNVNTYQTFVETEKAGYLIRQWVGTNLYDRVSTQPYLAAVEKKWIAFQLLTCLRDARIRKVAHGDVKSENILITSDLSLLLTDFSSAFKPTHLPLDDPSDFSFFFDTSSRRTCYIAPERFYTSDSKLAAEKKKASTTNGGGGAEEEWGKRNGRVTEEMDVFSTGCVLAEMWTDGRTVFNLSELFTYREGSVGLEGILDHIEDHKVKEMISQMLARDPADRPSFDLILSSFRDSIFPEYFYTFLQDYVNSLSEASEPPTSVGQDSSFLQRSAGLSGTKIDRLLDEWESISIHLDKGPSENGPALLLLNVVTSSIRNCIWPSSRLHGLQLFLNISPYLFDEDKVDRIVPFVVELLSDDVAIVRAEACRTLVIIVESIHSITAQNATFIPEYLLPQMRHLAVDNDIFVRATYAKGLFRLADAAIKMLEMSQATKGVNPGLTPESSGIIEPDYDAMLQEIQAVVEEQATTLLVDVSPPVKRSMLASISDLCLFFGRQKSNETVLTHILTYLNNDDWMLRIAFFDGIVDVGAFIGVRAIEEYALPLVLQSLADSEEAVIARVILSLTSLATLGLLSRMRLWDIFATVRGFLCHPNIWIRQGTAGLIAATARNLPQTDVWCILYPDLRPLLHSDIKEMDAQSLLAAVLPPLSRSTLVAAKHAALQNTPAGFWDLRPAKEMTKLSLVKPASREKTSPRSLRDKGISEADEKKIEAMKECLVKQAFASQAREAPDTSSVPEAALVAGKSVSLTDLGITPQTIFISPRTVGVDAKADLKRLRPHLSDSPASRRTSFASRSNRGTVENQLDELKKRLPGPLEPISKVDKPVMEDLMTSHPESNATPSESGLSSSIDLAALTRTGRKKVDSKAAPAVAASHTNAMGTTTIHDEPLSGRATPLASATFALGTPRNSIGPAAAPYSSSYDGQDPGVRAFLEQVDLENYREPLLDFGPRITASHRKRTPKAKSGSASPQAATMIAHLTQHEGAITAIVTSPDSLFFATSSEDTQIFIWDSAKLERSVATKPRLVYRMDAPIVTMCRIENTHCLAAAAEDGQLHVLRIHAASSGGSSKYGRVECIRTWATDRHDGHITFVSHLHGEHSSLLLVTANSVIAILDIRNMEISKRFQHPLELGVITAICASTHWIVVGTSTGTLSLWDLRFGLLLKSWKAGGGVTSLRLHPSRGRGRWIIVSTARSADVGNGTAENSGPLIEVYDIETSKLVEIYQVRATRPSRSSEHIKDTDKVIPDKASFIAELARSTAAAATSDDLSRTITAEDLHTTSSPPQSSPKTVLDLIVGQSWSSLPRMDETILMSVPELGSGSKHIDGPGGQGGGPGWMVSAGEDRVVRYWDLVKVQDGFVICGSQKEKDVAFRQTTNADPAHIYTLPNVHRHNTVPTRDRERQPLRPHYDAICKLGTVETPFSSCVITGDRSGVVKVWRMESGSATTGR
ncbi:VPS15 protein kinase [Kwoniella heveanensis CBS 569]|nr:VPS15 protein kinase [Kwoniella heveanensis CBS 569]